MLALLKLTKALDDIEETWAFNCRPGPQQHLRATNPLLQWKCIVLPHSLSPQSSISFVIGLLRQMVQVLPSGTLSQSLSNSDLECWGLFRTSPDTPSSAFKVKWNIRVLDYTSYRLWGTSKVTRADNCREYEAAYSHVFSTRQYIQSA